MTGPRVPSPTPVRHSLYPLVWRQVLAALLRTPPPNA